MNNNNKVRRSRVRCYYWYRQCTHILDCLAAVSSVCIAVGWMWVQRATLSFLPPWVLPFMDRVALKFEFVVGLVLVFAAVACWLCVKTAFGVSMFWAFFCVFLLAWLCCIFCSLRMLSVFCSLVGLASFVYAATQVLMHVW